MENQDQLSNESTKDIQKEEIKIEEQLNGVLNDFQNIEFKDDNENKVVDKIEEKSEKKISVKTFQKYLGLFKLMRSVEILKNDNSPIEIINGIFIGSVGAAMNKKILEDLKITHIIVAAQGLTEFFPQSFKYKKFNILDSVGQNIINCFDEACEFIDECLINEGKILIHCFAGISRSSSIIISYLIKKLNHTLESALELCTSKREKINPNTGFKQQLKKYEEMQRKIE